MKRGQLDTVLTNIPVFILVLVIMAVFVLLVSLLGAIKPDHMPVASGAGEANFIFAKVLFENKERFLFDVIMENKIFFSPQREEMVEVLKIFLEEERDCIAFFKLSKAYSENRDLDNSLGGIFMGRQINGKNNLFYFDDASTLLREKAFEWPDKFSQFHYNKSGEDIFVYYYYGECLEVENE